MVGNATPMIDVSKITTNCAKESRANAFHLRGSGISAAVVVTDVDDDFDVIISLPPPLVFVIFGLSFDLRLY
jgi:hypothetical protein